MGLIKTTVSLRQTLKNINRFKEILTVFARNGFDEFILQSGLHSKIPNFVLPASKNRIQIELKDKMERRDWSQSLAYRLRKSFEELGPSFIKLGQLLSTREDFFDEYFIDEMKLLRDQVKGVPFEDVQKIIENSFGKKINEIFDSIEKEPIGTASIGVVYKAKLNNKEVVVKVRRASIEQIIETDFNILSILVEALENNIKELRFLGLSKLLADFKNTLTNEINFRNEVLNNTRFKEILKKYDEDKVFVIPDVYIDYCNDEVITMDFIEGIPFSDSQKINEYKHVILKNLNKGLSVFTNSILKEGFFHADLHGGNFFLMKDERIGLIDFGLFGSLGKKNRSNLIAILYSLLNHNYENLVYEFLDVANYVKIPDTDELIRDIRDALSPFVGLTVKQMNYSDLLKKTIRVLYNHQIILPREWFVVFRAMITIDGVGQSLDLDFDIFQIIEAETTKLMKSIANKDELIIEGIWFGRDLLNNFRMFPRHMSWFLKEFSKNNYTFQVKNTGYEKEIASISSSIRFLASSLLVSIFLICGTLLIENQTLGYFYSLPWLTLIFWVTGALIFLRSLFKR